MSKPMSPDVRLAISPPVSVAHEARKANSCWCATGALPGARVGELKGLTGGNKTATQPCRSVPRKQIVLPFAQSCLHPHASSTKLENPDKHLGACEHKRQDRVGEVNIPWAILIRLGRQTPPECTSKAVYGQKHQEHQGNRPRTWRGLGREEVRSLYFLSLHLAQWKIDAKGCVRHCPRECPAFLNRSTQSSPKCVVWS
jgi:hypothetical protein